MCCRSSSLGSSRNRASNSKRKSRPQMFSLSIMLKRRRPKTNGLDNLRRRAQHSVMRHVMTRSVEPNDPPPLTEPVFLILLSLAQAPRHGYALLKDTEALSDGRVRMSTGTLYGVIHRLL